MKHPIAIMTLSMFAALAAASPQTHARERGWQGFEYDKQSQVVGFRDLDPTQPAEARQLLQRVRNASFKVCHRVLDIRELHVLDDRDACVSESYAAAVADINRRHRVDLEAVAARDAAAAEVATVRE